MKLSEMELARVRACVAEGLTRGEIAERLGLTYQAVCGRLRACSLAAKVHPNAKSFKGGRRKRVDPDGEEIEFMQDDTSGARCRCGLRLPCNGCLPSLEEFARGGPGVTMPAPGSAAKDMWPRLHAAGKRIRQQLVDKHNERRRST